MGMVREGKEDACLPPPDDDVAAVVVLLPVLLLLLLLLLLSAFWSVTLFSVVGVAGPVDGLSLDRSTENRIMFR
jgi:hypothetical protein